MNKLNYDDETAKNLDKKLKDFYARWDTTSKEEKQQVLDKVMATLKELPQIDLSQASEEERKQVQTLLRQIATMIDDTQQALGHRITGATDAIAEHIKCLAEQGNPDAQKAWDKLKADYIKNKYDKLTDN